MAGLKKLKVNTDYKAASAHGQRMMEKGVGEGTFLRHLHSESLPVDMSLHFMNGSW